MWLTVLTVETYEFGFCRQIWCSMTLSWILLSIFWILWICISTWFQIINGILGFDFLKIMQLKLLTALQLHAFDFKKIKIHIKDTPFISNICNTLLYISSFCRNASPRLLVNCLMTTGSIIRLSTILLELEENECIKNV